MPDPVARGTALEIVRLQLSDVPDCIDIARQSFDQFERDADAVRNWLDARIIHNPWQRTLDGIGVGIRDGGKLIAFRAMFAQPWWIEGQPTVIAFAAHTSINPSYRGCGLGSQLIAASRSISELTGSTSAGDITQRIYKKQGFGRSSGWTPLLVAQHHEQFKTAAMLLEKGADPNIRSDQGRSAWDMASAEGAPKELVDLMISKGRRR